MANECVHSRFKERLLGLIFKLDLEKACDRVDIEVSPILAQKNGVWREVEFLQLGSPL